MSHIPANLTSQQSLHMDAAILSISPSGAIDPAPNGEQRKITLLTRPQPASSSQVLGSGSVIPAVLPPSLSSGTISSDLQSPPQHSAVEDAMSQAIISGQTTSITGRAARNDYFDTEDPSVNLHDFIVNSMQAPKNRVILLKLEEEFMRYLGDINQVGPLKLPPWDSYHRMLAHRTAAYFGLEHNVDPLDKTCVVVCKGPNTRVPTHRFNDYLPVVDIDETETAEPKLILKRAAAKETKSLEKFEAALASSNGPEAKSFEQREEEYEKTRARIFNQQPSLPHSHSAIAFDLAGTSSPQQSSSIFPSIMHHRRTASDTATALYRRPSADFKKDGPSSSHSSRSVTPLFASLLRTGIVSETSPQAEKQATQPQLPQPPSAHETVQQQTVMQTQPLATPSSASSSQISHLPQSGGHTSKYNAHSTDASVVNRNPQQLNVGASMPTSAFQYHSMPPGIPVLYPQQAAVVANDPSSWYAYQQQMMMYQQGAFIPAAQYGAQIGVYHVNQPYSVAPAGMVSQQAVLSPPGGPHPATIGMRLPLGPGGMLDQLASPSHPGSVALVRPVPQQASPAGLQGKIEPAPWTVQHPHGYAVPQFSVAQDSEQLLAEQMEKKLNISGNEVYPSSQPAGDGITATALQDEGTSKQQADSTTNSSNGSANNVSSYAMVADPTVATAGGQVVSPTHAPIQFMPSMQAQIYGGEYIANQQMMPPHHPAGMIAQYPVAQPSTPPVGALNLAPPNLVQAQQPHGIFSPTTTVGIHSPVQILGHTLGTSLFSPPPHTTNQHHVMLVNSPTSSGKIVGFSPGGGSSSHPPVGSGTSFRRFDSPKHGGLIHVTEVPNSVPPHTQSAGAVISPQGQYVPQEQSPMVQHKQTMSASKGGNGMNPASSGFQTVQLPPRLAQQQQSQQQQQRNRYQNQRHPANRAPGKAMSTGSLTLGDHMPSQFVPANNAASPGKREPLLPTPPSNQMMKLDTSLSCGVPLNIVEVLGFPPEGSPDRQKAVQSLYEIGAEQFKCGRLPKSSEEVVIAVFASQESAINALHVKCPCFSLSVPRNTHARFILTLLEHQHE